jgi:hypothetical protein
MLVLAGLAVVTPVGQTLQAMHIKKWQTVIATEAHPVSQ